MRMVITSIGSLCASDEAAEYCSFNFLSKNSPDRGEKKAGKQPSIIYKKVGRE